MRINKIIEDVVKVFGLSFIGSSFFLCAKYLKAIPFCSPYSDFLFYGMGIFCMFTVGIIVERIWEKLN